MPRAAAVILVALVSIPRVGWAQAGVPVGPEFLVNAYTTGNQDGVSVAADPESHFVVVWRSDGQDGDGSGVFGQRYFITGLPRDPEFRVNTYTPAAQYDPSMAASGAGEFVVVWTSVQAGSSNDVLGQRFGASGAPVGPEFRVNTYTSFPSVALDASGDFVVVQNDDQEGSGLGVFGQRYASSGAPLGAEFRVNTYTTNAQAWPAVASNGGGSFVVVWQSQGQDGSAYGVFSQRYNTIVPVELMQFGVE